jgi:hypothetical protein
VQQALADEVLTGWQAGTRWPPAAMTWQRGTC